MIEYLLLQILVDLLHFARLLLDVVVHAGVLGVLVVVVGVLQQQNTVYKKKKTQTNSNTNLVPFAVQRILRIQMAQLEQTRLIVQQLDLDRTQFVGVKVRLGRHAPQRQHPGLNEILVGRTLGQCPLQPIDAVANIALLLAHQIGVVHVVAVLFVRRQLIVAANLVGRVQFVFVDGVCGNTLSLHACSEYLLPPK